MVPDFIDLFMAESNAARAVVEAKDAEGRNTTIPVQDQFPSTIFVLDMIRMKLNRAESYLAAENFAKYREELQDCSNYSLFAVLREQLKQDV